MQMFDPKFPQAGLMGGNFMSLTGAFDSCLKANSGYFRGKYCLMGLNVPKEENDMNPRVHKFQGERSFAFMPADLKNSWIRFASCIPSTCTNDDAMFGMNTFLEETQITGSAATYSITYGCQSDDDVVELN